MPHKFPRVLAVLGAGFGIVLVTGLGAAYYLGRPLNPASEYGISTPTLPTENAYPVYLAASRAFRERPVALVLDYRADQEQKEDPKKYPLAAKKAWLAENAKGFQLFEKAVKLPCVYPALRSIPTEVEDETAALFRPLAKYIEVRNQVWAQSGQSEKAAQGALDIWQMGIDMTQGAPLLPTTQGQAVEIFARRSLNSEIAHLHGPAATRAAKRLERILATRVPYPKMLQAERASVTFLIPRQHDKALKDAEQAKRDAAAIEKGQTTFFYDTSPPPRHTGFVHNVAVRLSTWRYLRALDKVMNQAAEPWSRRAVPPNTVPASAGVEEKLINVVLKGRFFHERSDALGQLFLARLALHGYRKDNGRYPDRLDEISPKYLSKIPTDPFADGAPLKYRKDGKRYKLWSVGPDSRDDGARPALNPNPRRPTAKYLVTAESTGDIVANVSR